MHFLGTWPRSFSHKCLYSKLVKMANYAFQHTVASTYQVAERQSRRNIEWSKMAYHSMVPPNLVDVDKKACSSSKREVYYQSTSHGNCSSTQETATSVLCLIRKSLKARWGLVSDFPSYLGILATINKTAVCLLPHQLEQVLRATPVWSFVHL